MVIASAVVFGLAAQGSKICVESLLQESVDDVLPRAGVQPVYDVLFNVAFVAAAAFTAALVPASGTSRAVFALEKLAVGYLLTALSAMLKSGSEPRLATQRGSGLARGCTNRRSSSHASWPPLRAAGGTSGSRPHAQAGGCRPTHLGPRADPEQRHDLVAVEIGTDRVSSSCSAQQRDALLERVVGARAAPPPCAGCGSCSPRGSACAAGRAAGRRRGRSGAPPSRSTRRRRSRGSAGAARPARRRRRRRPWGSAAPAAGPASCFAPTTSWWWKETPPPARSGGSAACRCRAAARPAAARGPGPSVGSLQGDGLLQHGQACARRRPCAGGARRSRAAAPGSSGSTCVGQPGVDEQREPRARVGAAAAAWTARPGPARPRRSSIRSAIARHRRDHRRRRRRSRAARRSAPRASCAADRRRRTSSGRRACAARRAARSASPPYGSTNSCPGSAHRHRVDGEVAPDAGRRRGVAVGDLGLARVAVVGLGAVGRDLAARSRPSRAPTVPKAMPDVPDGVGPAAARAAGRRSGRASVVKSRSSPSRPSSASRTEPPTSASSCPAAANRAPSSSATGRDPHQRRRPPGAAP